MPAIAGADAHRRAMIQSFIVASNMENLRKGRSQKKAHRIEITIQARLSIG